MAERLRVDLFVEDRAHEDFLVPLMVRLLKDEGSLAVIRTRTALGGHGRMLEELAAYQKAVHMRQRGLETPDILIVARDSNCENFVRARKAMSHLIDRTIFPAFAYSLS